MANIFSGFRDAKDLLVVRYGTRDYYQEFNKDEDILERFGRSIAQMVQDGVIDPVVAEDMLSKKQANQKAERTSISRKSENASTALERLVVRGVIDPVFAENILDRFSRRDFEDAISSSLKSLDRKDF